MRKFFTVSCLGLMWFTVKANAQEEASSCGTRVTYFMAKYFDRAPASLEATSQLIRVASDGISTLLGIHDGLASLGIQTGARRISLGELEKGAEPSIVTLRTDDGPHFLLLMPGSIKDGKVTLIDPPETEGLSIEQFSHEWDGVALIVKSVSPQKSSRVSSKDARYVSGLSVEPRGDIEPVASDTQFPTTEPRPSPSPSVTAAVWKASTAEIDLGRVVLPRTSLETQFAIENLSSQVIQIDKVVPSCGCTQVHLESTVLAGRGSTKATVRIAPSEAASGLQTYSVAVTSTTRNVPPLLVNIHVQFLQVISVRPRQVSFGAVMKLEAPPHATIELLRGGSGEALAFKSVSASVPWLKATITDSDIVDVAVDPSLPEGPFTENIMIETERGAINVPATGEGVGSFRAMPNPVVAFGDENDATLRVVASSDKPCDLNKLTFAYDKESITATPADGTDGSKVLKIHFLKTVDGIATYQLKIVDPVTASVSTVNIFHGLIRDPERTTKASSGS